jgi:hypothetical protein
VRTQPGWVVDELYTNPRASLTFVVMIKYTNEQGKYLNAPAIAMAGQVLRHSAGVRLPRGWSELGGVLMSGLATLHFVGHVAVPAAVTVTLALSAAAGLIPFARYAIFS